MTPSESPAGARRRLRLALRRLREERGLTQKAVADLLDWSISKVNRIEVGDVTVSVTDLHALLGLYEHDDPAEKAMWSEAARIARRRGWWDDPEFRASATSQFVQYVQLESHATAIRTFQHIVIAGLLQTEEYATAIHVGHSGELGTDSLADRVGYRLRRQAEAFSRQPPPEVYFLLDESVLLREVGGLRAFAGQLEHLLARMDRDEVRVRVLAMTDAVFVTRSGGYTLLGFDGEDAVLFREDEAADSIVEADSAGEEMVRRYRGRFDEGWAAALTESASRHLIEARRADILVRLDRMQQN